MAALNGFVLSEYTLLEMGSCDWEYLTVHSVAYLKTFETHDHFPISNWVEGSHIWSFYFERVMCQEGWEAPYIVLKLVFMMMDKSLCLCLWASDFYLYIVRMWIPDMIIYIRSVELE